MAGYGRRADLGLDVQQLEPAVSDLQEQVLAPHPALSIHLLQLLHSVFGVPDSLSAQLTCDQVLWKEEEAWDWEQLWRGSSQQVVGGGQGGGKAAEEEDMGPASHGEGPMQSHKAAS